MMKKNWKSSLKKPISLLTAGLLLITPVFSEVGEKKYRADEAPHPLKDLSVTEHIGDFIDLNLSFTNEKQERVFLKQYFKEEPVLMTVIYYNCPSLCNFHLNGLFEGLRDLAKKGQSSYQLLLVSMDDKEKPALAREKKANYLKEFKGLKADKIHFLTGSQENIKKLTKALGFPFRWDEETEQFAHSPVAYTLSPKGMISRYLYGVEFRPKTLKLALLEASAGKTGNMIDRILLFCYRFNPKANQYSLYAMNLMKVGGVLIILILLALLVPAWIRERKRNV